MSLFGITGMIMYLLPDVIGEMGKLVVGATATTGGTTAVVGLYRLIKYF
jgi:hypothetical protein